MKKTILSSLLIIVIFFIGVSQVSAQMMRNYSTPSINPTDIQQQQQDKVIGKKLFEQLQSNQTNCQKLTNTDFEKIGEYV